MYQKSTNPLAQCLLKFDSEEKGVFSGYASKFNGNDSYNDTIAPGAFAKSLKSGKVIKGFFNHNSDDVPPIDWIEKREDDAGLFVVGRVDFNHHMGKSIHSAMEREAIDGMSIGFKMGKKDFEAKEGFDAEEAWRGNRLIKNVDLMEVSVVTYPADDSARISAVKAEVLGFKAPQDFERCLRDVGGFSKSMATTFVSQFIKMIRSDSDASDEQITEEEAKAIHDALSSLGNRF